MMHVTPARLAWDRGDHRLVQEACRTQCALGGRGLGGDPAHSGPEPGSAKNPVSQKRALRPKEKALASTEAWGSWSVAPSEPTPCLALLHPVSESITALTALPLELGI